jgi:DNA-binding NarL/FixJ family response regulator
VIRAWLARLVAAGQGNREISAGLFICVKAASVRVPGIAGQLSVAGRGEAAAAACSPA